MIRVAIIYAVVGFSAVEAANNFFTAFGLPEWATTLVAALVIVGFPAALAIASAFDRRPNLTGEANLPTGARDATTPKRASRARRIVLVAAGIAAAAVLGYLMLSGPLRGRLTPGEPHVLSIAVLPLDNIGGDPETEYFSDGMTDDVITHLSKIGDLKVISRASIMQYKDTKKTVPVIADELNVAHVLEGSVRRARNRVRVTAQLIEARSDDHLWAETYDRELQDVFEIQSDIAQRIAFALETRLSSAQRRRAQSKLRHGPSVVRRIPRRPRRYRGGGGENDASLAAGPAFADREHRPRHHPLLRPPL